MKIHFIGIGGIGVSALAQYYLVKGHEVSGSDLVWSEIIDELKNRGVKITIGKEDPLKLSKKFDLIIHTPAVSVRHRTSNILSYPEALGELTKQFYTIAVCGTHGKSTTTSMIGLILTKAGLDPTVVVGSKVREFGDTNCRVGKSQYLVIEADEHFASFLNYWPQMIVITNVEADHLDYYKNIRNIEKAFSQFIGHLPKNGILIDLRSPLKLKRFVNSAIDTERLRKILKVPGEHNVFNALAALAVARALKISNRISFHVFSEFRGIWRRFEEKDLKIGKYKLRVVSDYGHHPTEIRATLSAAREKWLNKRIWCVFQPHQYQRTHYLLEDFVRVLRKMPIDKIIITDIYDVAGREAEKIKRMVDSQKLVKTIAKESVVYVSNAKLAVYLRKNFQHIDVLIVMGAGDIYRLVDQIS